MALHTTLIGLSTTPVEIFSPNTTWANSAGASLYDTTPLILYNDGSIAIRISGSSSTAATGLPVAAGAYYTAQMMKGDRIFGFTTASTANVIAQAGRQLGGI